MNRFFDPHPELEGRFVVRHQLNADEMRAWVESPGLNAPPLGYRPFIRVENNILTWGLEKIPEGAAGAVLPPAGGDNLDAKTVPELQTLCGMRSIRYGKTDGKVELIQLLRAKK